VTDARLPDRRCAVLSLGSNVGDRLAMLQLAVDSWDRPGDEVVALSPVYETDPVGGPEQDDFLNAVMVVATGATPRELLSSAHETEQAAHRVRLEHWGPRTLDVDVIAVGDEVVDEPPDLVVPHPRAYERAFVLVPWLATDPQAALPGRGRVDVLLAGLDTTGVRPRPDLALRPPRPVHTS
jgi:2-amino-4-hydroxy-6-hydroxymethyldihydropteridine diphosphokinase